MTDHSGNFKCLSGKEEAHSFESRTQFKTVSNAETSKTSTLHDNVQRISKEEPVFYNILHNISFDISLKFQKKKKKKGRRYKNSYFKTEGWSAYDLESEWHTDRGLIY